jgi:hypothetical protein
MRISLLLVAILFSLSAGPAPAKQQDKSCTPTVAAPATIATIQKDFKDWSGRCVRLRGLAYANHLFTDRMATLTLIGRFEAAGDESIAIYPEE